MKLPQTDNGARSIEALHETIQALRSALRLLLDDAEAVHGGVNAHGMPVTDPDHPWHESILSARAALETAQ